MPSDPRILNGYDYTKEEDPWVAAKYKRIFDAEMAELLKAEQEAQPKADQGVDAPSSNKA
jgi:hypothetical protein